MDLAKRSSIECESRDPCGTGDSANQMSAMEPGRLLRLATVASVATTVVLIVAKLGAWLLTDSVGIAASLVDSTMDALASGVNLLAVHYSLQPPVRHAG